MEHEAAKRSPLACHDKRILIRSQSRNDLVPGLARGGSQGHPPDRELACRPVNPGGRPPLRRPVSGVWLPMTVLLALPTEAVPEAVLEEPTVPRYGAARRDQARNPAPLLPKRYLLLLPSA